MDLKDIKLTQVIDSFETDRCSVFIIDTGLTVFGEKIYSCVSIHKFKEIINVRFGNKTQIESMSKTYVRTQYTK